MGVGRGVCAAMKPSTMFLYSLSRSAGCRRECPHGITFFDGWNEGQWDFEDGELERLNALAISEPEHYVSVPDGPESASCNNVEYVTDCEKCMEQLARFEQFIWSHRHQIADFMTAKAGHYRALFAEANDTAAAIRLAEWEGLRVSGSSP